MRGWKEFGDCGQCSRSHRRARGCRSSEGASTSEPTWTCPVSLAVDQSYDSADFRWELRRRGIQPSISRWGWKHRRQSGRSLVHPVSQSRRNVERCHRWLDNWRRLVTTYDWYTESYVAFLAIASFIVALARIL